MSVSFIEPDVAKLRLELGLNSPNAVDPLASDDTTPVETLSLKEGADPDQQQHLSVNYATLANTNSNSLLFRRMSAASSVEEPLSDVESVRPKLEGSRKQSVASTLSTWSAISARSTGLQSLTESPFKRRISFDTISRVIPTAQPQTSSTFKFSRPSFSSSGASGLLGRTSLSDDSYCSFAVSCKHEDHKTTYWSRSFLCSMSSANKSRRALQWVLENVLENGDELVCLKVDHDQNKEPAQYQQEAEDILASIVSTIDPLLEIKIVVEVAIGSIKTVVKKTMLLYQPALVVVGTTAKAYSNVMRYMTRKTLSK